MSSLSAMIILFLIGCVFVFFSEAIYSRLAVSPDKKLALDIVRRRHEMMSKPANERFEDLKTISLLENVYAAQEKQKNSAVEKGKPKLSVVSKITDPKVVPLVRKNKVSEPKNNLNRLS